MKQILSDLLLKNETVSMSFSRHFSSFSKKSIVPKQLKITFLSGAFQSAITLLNCSVSSLISQLSDLLFISSIYSETVVSNDSRMVKFSIVLTHISYVPRSLSFSS